MKTIKLFFIFVIYLNHLKSNDCNDLPVLFSSYEIALEIVRNSHFDKSERIDSSKSSWIVGLEFFSCDSEVGFLILKTQKQEYIHQDVPIEIWNMLKSTSSLGSFYNAEIKGKYPLQLD